MEGDAREWSSQTSAFSERMGGRGGGGECLEGQKPPTRRVWGLGFGVQGLEFRVQGSEFRVQGSGFKVQGLGFRV